MTTVAMRTCRFPVPLVDSTLGVTRERCGICPSANDSASPGDLRRLLERMIAPGVSVTRIDALAKLAEDEGARHGLCVPLSAIHALQLLHQIAPGELPPLSPWATAALRGLSVRSWPDGLPAAGPSDIL